MVKRLSITLFVVLVLLMSFIPASAASDKTMIGINVVLNTDITNAILADLGTHGKVRDVVYEIDALTMQVRAGELAAIQALPYVAAANPDAERNAAPVDAVSATDFTNGWNTWDLDAINVTNLQPGPDRVVSYDGNGIYVAVLDTGLVDVWRAYFPQERIAEEFAASFSGGGALGAGAVAEQPNKWEHDQNSHGTHVTSTILGFQRTATVKFNGVAPMATVIPVKVLNQNGSGWSSVIARGIVYVTDLKVNGDLGANPVVINMSLGGSVLDAMEKAAIDYAVANGVIVVASAGNRGAAGMGYPGAYEPVISVAASGWVNEWSAANWWYGIDVVDPTKPEDFYIADYSGREKPGQDLDVVAPGSWIVGPYKVNSGMSLSYYYLGGTSMASPHVAGIVALMAQKYPALTAAQAESILEGSAIYMAPGCNTVTATGEYFCWGADATGAGLVTADEALADTP